MKSNFENFKRKKSGVTFGFLLFMLVVSAVIVFSVERIDTSKQEITYEEYKDSLLFKQSSLTLEEVVESEELLNFYSLCNNVDKATEEELIVELQTKRIYTKSKEYCIVYFHPLKAGTLRVTSDEFWVMQNKGGSKEAITNKHREALKDGFKKALVILPNSVNINDVNDIGICANLEKLRIGSII